jgi:hypothetical protein
MLVGKKTTMMKKHSTTIAAATIITVVLSAAIVLGTQNIISQNALGQSNGSNIGSATNTTQSNNKEFWIKTVHLDGFANLKRNFNRTHQRRFQTLPFLQEEELN